MSDHLLLPYTGSAPGADSNAYTLFDSSVEKLVTTGSYRLENFSAYMLSLQNAKPGSIVADFSDDAGATWKPYYQRAVVASATREARYVVPVYPYHVVRVRWVNGGAAQTVWGVHQSLVDDSQSLDSAVHSAASLRAPIQGEVLPITVTTSSKTFAVPAAWLGSLVRIEADGGDVGLVISVDTTPAAADLAARATEGGSPIALTAPAGACYRVFASTDRDIPFPSNAVSFALVGSVACVARCHLAET